MCWLAFRHDPRGQCIASPSSLCVELLTRKQLHKHIRSIHSGFCGLAIICCPSTHINPTISNMMMAQGDSVYVHVHTSSAKDKIECKNDENEEMLRQSVHSY